MVRLQISIFLTTYQNLETNEDETTNLLRIVLTNDIDVSHTILINYTLSAPHLCRLSPRHLQQLEDLLVYFVLNVTCDFCKKKNIL